MLVGLTILLLFIPLAIYHSNPSWIMSLRWLLRWPSTEKETAEDHDQGLVEPAASAGDEPPPTGSSESTPKASPALRNDPPPFISLDAGDDDDEDDDDLPPPQFPAANSAQRASSTLAPPPQRPPTASTTPAPPRPPSSLMPPPPRPPPRLPAARPLAPATSAAGRSLGGGLAPAPTPASAARRPSRKVVLAPGHSPLDWALLQAKPGANLAGVLGPGRRVTPSMLRAHGGRRGMPAWSSYRGRVYNLTPYLPFHPGGEGELRRAAGRDGEALFVEVHPWVNWEQMLGRCVVGVLVAEEEAGSGAGAGLEDLD